MVMTMFYACMTGPMHGGPGTLVWTAVDNSPSGTSCMLLHDGSTPEGICC